MNIKFQNEVYFLLGHPVLAYLEKGLCKAIYLSMARHTIIRMEQDRNTSFMGYSSWGLRYMQDTKHFIVKVLS